MTDTDVGFDLTIRLKDIILDEISKGRLTDTQLSACLTTLLQYLSTIVVNPLFKNLLILNLHTVLRNLENS
jgi:hypothetical protein